MIGVEDLHTYGWEAAIRGMRNPMNSWDRSDSGWDWVEDPSPINPDDPGMMFIVGENDLELMRRLAKAGPVHGKFLRMLTITMDIVAPLYWWKEFDTYKVGTVRNSCSTMHKIHAKPFEITDFSVEHLGKEELSVFANIIGNLNHNRERFIAKPQRKDYWWQMIQLLPSSYNQRATIQMNYEVARNIIKYRKDHKLDEWREFCNILVERLPYAEELICKEDEHGES